MRSRWVVAVLAVAGLLSGCTGTSGISSGGDQGFVSGQGGVSVVKAADRKTPSSVAGPSLATGATVSLSALKGKVVVLNVWGSWCGPCNSEAPGLADAARKLRSRGVVFLGINSRDSEQTPARSFVRQFKLPYDSIYDPDGRTLLAFHGLVTPYIPTTMVIDRQGRLAASFRGPITETTLTDLVQDVIRGGAA